MSLPCKLMAGIPFLFLAFMIPPGNEDPLEAWWVDSLTQLLEGHTPATTRCDGRIDTARGEIEAIQLALRSKTPCRARIHALSFGPGLSLRIRRVGRVPIVRGTHYTPPEERVAPPPVELPDPLYSSDELDLKPDSTQSFWLDVSVPAETRAGEYRTAITVSAEGTDIVLPLVLRVYPVTIPHDGELLLTNWFSVRPKELGYGDARTGSKAWWESATLLFDSMWAHRQNMFWTPLRPPWIQPKVTDEGALDFDFSFLDRWVEEFSRPRDGIRKTYIEGQPIASRKGYDGHVKARIWQIVDGAPRETILEVDDAAARKGYRIFLEALRDHLRVMGWLYRFRIHITDEPHGAQLEPYGVLAGYVREFAPEFRIMEALDVKDDFAFFEKNCDVWVPQLGRFNKTLPRLLERLQEGKEVWIYTCLWPNGNYPNRFVDYPLIKTRVLQWINFKWGFTGYLHWGFNHWRGDPFKDMEPHHAGSTHLPAGDAWIVYPGDREVLDSIRHEAMRDGVEEFELLTLLAREDTDRARALAEDVVRSFTDYERNVEAFRAIRQKLLEAFE